MLIRAATIADAPRISAFVSAIAREQIGPTLSAAGVEYLLAGMNAEHQEERLRSGFEFHVAEDQDAMLGIVAFRLPAHLYYLFVHPDHQRIGIGRQLWQRALERIRGTSHEGTITVNSSLNAIAFYERLGFCLDGPVAELHEVRYQPMRLTIATDR